MRKLTKEILQKISERAPSSRKYIDIGIHKNIYYIPCKRVMHGYRYNDILIIKNSRPELYYISNFECDGDFVLDLDNNLAFKVIHRYNLNDDDTLRYFINCFRNKYVLPYHVSTYNQRQRIIEILDRYAYDNDLYSMFNSQDYICSLLSPKYEYMCIELIKNFYRDLPKSDKYFIDLSTKLYSIINKLPKIEKVKTIDNRTKYWNILDVKIPIRSTVTIDIIRNNIPHILKLVKLYSNNIVEEDMWRYLKISKITLTCDHILVIQYQIKGDGESAI